MEVEWDDVEAAQKYVSEPGSYHSKCISNELKKGPGDWADQWELTWEVQAGPAKGQTFRDWMTLSQGALPRIKVLYSRVGLETTGKAKLSAADVVGKECYVLFEQDEKRIKDENGRWVGTGEWRLRVAFAGFRAIEDGPHTSISQGPPAGAGGDPFADAGGEGRPDDDQVPFAWLLAFILGGLMLF